LKVVKEKSLEKDVAFGDVHVCFMNLVEKSDFIVRTVIIPPHSSVPTRPHSHIMRQINYIVEGSATITNGEESVDLSKGDFIMLESFEEHYFSTTNLPVHVFEIQYE